METELGASFDVVIVGGRPAGASLAARLGAAGRSVLVVDKADLPCPPAVPSCPILYPQAMALLDEIGVEERAYAHGAVKVERFQFQFGPWFDASFRMISSRGRDYVLGIDRARFDHALWDHLARYPTVSRRAGFAVTGLLRDGQRRVIGVEGREGGSARQVSARVVVAADGRFSPVARWAGAKVTEDHAAHTSTVYWADWEGVAPIGDETGPTVHVYATGRGTDVLFFPLPDGRITVCTHQRSDRVHTAGHVEAYYLEAIGRYEPVRRRIAEARRVTGVIGMKKVANRYLEPGGPGWALVGDALHHKDPVDGQGIYDALLGSKLLAEALETFLDGRVPWDEAVAAYGRRVLAETRPMFLATMDRLKNELYGEPPVPVIRTLIRWWMNDPEYQERFLRFLCRDIDPERWRSAGLLWRATARGVRKDLFGR